jgi:hypothetical protein
MKILTFKRVIALTAIGGVAYVHKQRGGDWTLASITDTLRHLWSSAGRKLAPVKGDTLERAASVTEHAVHSGLSDDRTARPHGEYSGRKDDGRH